MNKLHSVINNTSISKIIFPDYFLCKNGNTAVSDDVSQEINSFAIS